MKKGKIILVAIAIISVAGAFTLRAGGRSTSNLYSNSTCTNKIQCQTVDAGIGICQVSLTLYAFSPTCKLWTGSKFASPNL